MSALTKAYALTNRITSVDRRVREINILVNHAHQFQQPRLPGIDLSTNLSTAFSQIYPQSNMAFDLNLPTIPEFPDIESTINYSLNQPELPEVEDMNRKITFLMEQPAIPEFPNIEKTITFNAEKPHIPEVQNMNRNIVFTLEKPTIPDVPNIERHIRYNVIQPNLPITPDIETRNRLRVMNPTASIAAMPAFHSGGLAKDELLAILQSGEYVLSRHDVAAIRVGNYLPVFHKIERVPVFHHSGPVPVFHNGGTVPRPIGHRTETSMSVNVTVNGSSDKQTANKIARVVRQELKRVVEQVEFRTIL